MKTDNRENNNFNEKSHLTSFAVRLTLINMTLKFLEKNMKDKKRQERFWKNKID